MKEIIREAVERRMPDKESIRINAMQEKKKPMPKRAYAVLAVAVMLAVCTCITVPMMINEPQLPPVTIETTTKTDSTPRQDETTTVSDDTTLFTDTTNSDDPPEIGGSWPICMYHHDSYHSYTKELIDIVGDEAFRAWIDPIEQNWEYIPYTETECPFPDSNIVEFIKYFKITDEQLIEVYKADIYGLQWDIKALIDGDYETFEKHAVEINKTKSYKKLQNEYLIKLSLIQKIGTLKDNRSVEYYNSITDNGKYMPVDKVTVLDLVENTSLTREDIQKCIDSYEDCYKYDIRLLFEDREEYKRMISELEIPYYESEIKLIDGLLHIE